MRRFLLLSILAVIVGLGLAGVGYWAVWSVMAPRTVGAVSRAGAGADNTMRTAGVVTLGNADEVQRLLDETSWISAGEGQGDPVWIVGDRAALDQAAKRIEAMKPGAALRIVPFAPADENGVSRASGPDRATVAELWLSRDWLLYGRWLATEPDKWTAAGIPPADRDTARSELVETGRRFVERLAALTRADGLDSGYPLVVWQGRDGTMKACACLSERAWKAVDIASEVPSDTAPKPINNASATAAPASTYPKIASPVTRPPEQPSTPRAGAPEGLPRPARVAPARTESERKAPRQTASTTDRSPRAERQADSMFY